MVHPTINIRPDHRLMPLQGQVIHKDLAPRVTPMDQECSTEIIPKVVVHGTKDRTAQVDMEDTDPHHLAIHRVHHVRVITVTWPQTIQTVQTKMQIHNIRRALQAG